MNGIINNFRGHYWFLSNFYPHEVSYRKQLYPTVEHAYQAAKTLDKSMRDRIRRAPKPGDAKRLGKQVKLRQDWEAVKLPIMLYLVRKKFQDFQLRTLLAKTRPRLIVHENTWRDTFWGVCDGVGENHLGKILMQVRSEVLAFYENRRRS